MKQILTFILDWFIFCSILILANVSGWKLWVLMGLVVVKGLSSFAQGYHKGMTN